MTIQIPHRCEFYKKNENMNKTCSYKGIERMCKIYYGEVCKEYKEKKDERSNIRINIVNDNNNTNNSNGNTCGDYI